MSPKDGVIILKGVRKVKHGLDPEGRVRVC